MKSSFGFALAVAAGTFTLLLVPHVACTGAVLTSVPVPDSGSVDVEGGTACEKNQQCLDEAGGAPAICRKSDRRCVHLTTPECPTVFTRPGNSDLANDDVVIIGALTPTGQTELGTVMELALEMVRSEISNSFLKGLPPNGSSGRARPLAIVACRESGSGLDGELRAANHLAKEVQVPLVIGPVDPASGGLVASQAFLPNRVLNILPTTGISSLAKLPSPIAPTPLIWRLNFDDRAIAAVTSKFVLDQLQPKLAAAGIAPPYRVAVLSSADLLAQGVQSELLNVLKFNGTAGAPDDADKNHAMGSCPSSSTGRCLEIYNVGDINDTLGNPDPEAQIAATLAALHSFQPHIILHSYGAASIPKVFFPCEAAFPGSTKPFHVGLSTEWNGFGPLFPFLSAVPGRNGRLFSIQNYSTRATPPFPVDSPEVTEWLERFNILFPEYKDSVSPRSQSVWLLYDAMYLAAYAIVALGDRPVTGENLALVLSRFNPPGPPITTYSGGPDIDKAFAELKAGRNVDLQGLSGTMDFDVAVGAPVYGLEMTCPSLAANGGMKGSGFHYKVETKLAVVTSPDGKTDGPPTSPLNGCPSP